MDKATFLQQLHVDRDEWETLLRQVAPDSATEHGFEGPWSLCDVLAHLAWYEREVEPVARDRVMAGSPLWYLPVDERNAAIAQLSHPDTFAGACAAEQTAYADLLAALETLDDADFADPSRFRDMPAEWKPWEMFASNTFEHYQQHLPALRTWLSVHRAG